MPLGSHLPSVDLAQTHRVCELPVTGANTATLGFLQLKLPAPPGCGSFSIYLQVMQKAPIALFADAVEIDQPFQPLRQGIHDPERSYPILGRLIKYRQMQGFFNSLVVFFVWNKRPDSPLYL
jgi:hypothetical protein